MTEMRNPVYAPYGAYAMKESYQRNLVLANVITAVMVGAVVVIGALWPGEKVVTIQPEPIKVAVRLDQLPQPSIVRDKSDWPSAPPVQKERIGFGPPKPVPDDKFAEDQEMMLATRQERADNIGAGEIDVGDGRGVIIDTSIADLVPEPTKFVPVEIPPRVVRHYRGDYPRLAEMIGAEGTVHVYVLLDEDGNPLEARLAKSSGTEVLDEAGMVWGMKCRFSPGIQNGRPIKVWVVVKYEFKLD